MKTQLCLATWSSGILRVFQTMNDIFNIFCDNAASCTSSEILSIFSIINDIQPVKTIDDIQLWSFGTNG
jgi:hypothetical protein